MGLLAAGEAHCWAIGAFAGILGTPEEEQMQTTCSTGIGLIAGGEA